PLRIRWSQIRGYSPTDPADSAGVAVAAVAAASSASMPCAASVLTAPRSSGPGLVDAKGQPSEPRSGPSVPCVRCQAPVVIRSTTDAVLQCAAGPTGT